MQPADCPLRLALDREVEPRRELDRAHHAHGILAEADHRIANRTDEPLLQVLKPAHPIDHRIGLDVVEKAVHREVAPMGIRLWRAERVVLLRTLRRMFDDLAHRLGVLAEGRRLDHLPAGETHMGETEAAPDEEAVAEHPLDLVRRRVRAHVEVLGRTPQQQVAHPSAHKIRRVAAVRKPIEHPQRIGVDVPSGDAVRGALADDGRASFPFHTEFA